MWIRLLILFTDLSALYTCRLETGINWCQCCQALRHGRFLGTVLCKVSWNFYQCRCVTVDTTVDTLADYVLDGAESRVDDIDTMVDTYS